MNIYEQLNRINDTESLSEKYIVKNARELKKLKESQTKRAKKIKLHESLSDIQEEAIAIAKEYILDNYSWSDWDSDIEGTTLTLTIWFDDTWGGEDSSETVFTLDVNKLVEYMGDEEALGSYIESGEDYINYEARGQEFYERAAKELEKHFGCTNAFLEPSTQMGRGGTFLFSDDMSFEGNFDYQTGEQYIHNDNFDGFLQLCLASFRPRRDESFKESRRSRYVNNHSSHEDVEKKLNFADAKNATVTVNIFRRPGDATVNQVVDWCKNNKKRIEYVDLGTKDEVKIKDNSDVVIIDGATKFSDKLHKVLSDLKKSTHKRIIVVLNTSTIPVSQKRAH